VTTINPSGTCSSIRSLKKYTKSLLSAITALLSSEIWSCHVGLLDAEIHNLIEISLESLFFFLWFRNVIAEQSNSYGHNKVTISSTEFWNKVANKEVEDFVMSHPHFPTLCATFLSVIPGRIVISRRRRFLLGIQT
jgi:hypothetical protein